MAFTAKFTEKHQSIICRDLPVHDISDPEGLKLIKAQNLFDKACGKMIEDALEIADEIIAGAK